MVGLAEQRLACSSPRHVPAVTLEHSSSAALTRRQGRWSRAVGDYIEKSADPGLPQLKILRDPALMGLELESAVYGEPVTMTGIEVVRHKPARRCVLRYDVRIGPPERQRDERLYGKTFAGRRAQRAYSAIEAIAEAQACGARVRLPTPVGYVEHLDLLLQREVPGQPSGEVLFSQGKVIAPRIADAVHSLHSSGLELPRRHYLRDEVDPLTDRVDRLSEVCPRLTELALRCLHLVQDGARGSVTWRCRPVHRDFYHDQVLVGVHGLSVLDFDDAKMSEPALDVANFLAHLRLLSLQQKGILDALEQVAFAFEERYLAHDPCLDAALVRFLEGSTLLRLAHIHLGRERGEWMAERLLEQSECILRNTLHA